MNIACPLCNARLALTDESPARGLKQDVCDHCSANLVFMAAQTGSSQGARSKRTALNGTKVLIILALVCVTIINYTAFGAAVFGVQHAVKDSEPYKMSESFVRNSEDVKRLIGQPMEFGFFPNAQFHSNPDRSTAAFALNVQGPQGSTVVNLKLLKEEADWQIVHAHYLDPEGQARTLVAEPTDAPQPAIAEDSAGSGRNQVAPLTRTRIERLYANIDRAANERDPEGIVTHMTEDVVIHVSLRLPHAVQDVTMTRAQYERKIKEGFAAAQDYSFLRKVTNITIAQDGERAQVQSRTLERMTVSGRVAELVGEETATVELRDGRPVITRVQTVGRMANL